MLAAHLTFTAYGSWLPNDPRGSGSKSVGSWPLFAHGGATRLEDRSVSVAGRSFDPAWRDAARADLKFPPVVWTGVQAVAIARGFEQSVNESEYRLWALAILPDHVHVVVAEHATSPTRIAGHLKGRATQELRASCGWPPDQPVWGKRSWVSWLNSDDAVLAAIRYVEENPVKAGLKPQRWRIVTPYTS